MPCYYRENLTMRPTYHRYNGCPENFRESLSTPTATFPDISSELLFRSILWMCLQNLKFVALPVPEIGQSMYSIRLRSLFYFLWAFLRMDPSECIWSPYSFTDKWENSIWSFGWGFRTPILENRRPFERALVSSCKLSIVTFRLSLRVSEIIAAFVLQRAIFPPHL